MNPLLSFPQLDSDEKKQKESLEPLTHGGGEVSGTSNLKQFGNNSLLTLKFQNK